MTVSELEITEVILHARRFDLTALGQVYDAYYPQIYRYINFRVCDEQTSREISHQVFVRLIETIKKRSRSIDNMTGWLFESVRDLVEQYLSTANEMAFQPRQAVVQISGQPDQEIAWLEELVCKSMRHLDPEAQHLLALRFANFLTSEEIARIMGKNIADVKMLQFEALEDLRVQLEQEA